MRFEHTPKLVVGAIELEASEGFLRTSIDDTHCDSFGLTPERVKAFGAFFQALSAELDKTIDKEAAE